VTSKSVESKRVGKRVVIRMAGPFREEVTMSGGKSLWPTRQPQDDGDIGATPAHYWGFSFTTEAEAQRFLEDHQTMVAAVKTELEWKE